jgi:hypothetical protein
MQRKVGLSLAILLCLTASVLANPVVTVGNYNLLANTAGQTIVMTVSGIDPNNVSGIVMAVETDNGGPAFPGGVVGPLITGIDWDSGPSIWVFPNSAGHNPANTFLAGQSATSDFLTTSGFVNVNSGILVTLTIDTTGLGPGVHSLQLIGNQVDDAIANSTGPTDFTYSLSGGSSTITDGTITIVPEPSSVVLGLFAIAGLGAVAIRKRRARRA